MFFRTSLCFLLIFLECERQTHDYERCDNPVMFNFDNCLKKVGLERLFLWKS